MPTDDPAELAASIERGLAVPEGPGHRYSGFSVLGVTFAGGDVLALRRFPASSTGGGYTSVWHRDGGGRWTFYADAPAEAACTRYFAEPPSGSVVAPIRLEWVGPRRLEVAVDSGRLVAWSLSLAGTPATRALTACAAHLPERWRQRPRALACLGVVASVALGAGRLRLTGRTPSGALFLASPRRLWAVAHTRASVGGRDLGPAGPLVRQAALGDFRIPQRGLFAFGHAFMVER